MKIELTLYRNDLLNIFKTTPIEDVTCDKFKVDLDLFEKSTIVVFVDDDGRYRMLKEKYSPSNLNTEEK